MSVAGLAMLLVGRMWNLGMWFRKVIENFKLGLMNRISWRMEDSGAESNVNYNSLAQEGFVGENISKRPGDQSCDVLAKNVATFYPFPKNRPEAKLQSFG